MTEGGIKGRDRNDETPEGEGSGEQRESLGNKRVWQKEKRKTEIKMEGQCERSRKVRGEQPRPLTL